VACRVRDRRGGEELLRRVDLSGRKSQRASHGTGDSPGRGVARK
jgi:hypothetical protein